MHSDTTLNLETQIVIIGGGGAGLAAAVAAAEKGADVIVLEKRRKPGGNSAMAVGLFGAESPLHMRMWIDAQRDELFRLAMEYSHWRINPRIIRAFINKSGDTIRWLEEKGITFSLSGGEEMYYKRPQPIPVWHTVKGRGAAIIKALAKNGEDLGVQLLCETEVKEILTSDKKGVTGILATRKGEEFRIKASSVIIATGGYGGNKELLRKYCPDYKEGIDLAGIPNTGDGLLMATKIGAATEGLGILQLEAKHIPGEPVQMWFLALNPNTLWVNKRGERFMDEAAGTYLESGNAIARQPDNMSYTILDEGLKQDDKRLKQHTLGSRDADLGEMLQSAAGRGKVKISNSLDEIAMWMGAIPEVLKATLDEYNSFCDKGYDELFAKQRRYLIALRTPPYYAIRTGLRYLGTIGGIKINHNMEVLDHEDNPIPGLYATGIDAGGWETETYNKLLSGSTFGFAINSGRIAGENAVNKFALGRTS